MRACSPPSPQGGHRRVHSGTRRAFPAGRRASQSAWKESWTWRDHTTRGAAGRIHPAARETHSLPHALRVKRIKRGRGLRRGRLELHEELLLAVVDLAVGE